MLIAYSLAIRVLAIRETRVLTIAPGARVTCFASDPAGHGKCALTGLADGSRRPRAPVTSSERGPGPVERIKP